MPIPLVDRAGDFERWEVRAGLARGTVQARRYCLASWSAYIGEAWTVASWRDVEAWLEGRPQLGPRARSTAVSHVRAFYRWARREGLVDADPCADVARIKLPVRMPRPVRAHDAERAVGAGTARLEVASALMVYAGLRCCEVAGLRWADVDLAGGVLYVRGKGGRDAAVPIAAPLGVILAGCRSTVGPVVAAEGGGSLTAQRVSNLVGQHLRRLGIDATAHQLRHYAATHVLEQCGDLLLVRDFLRHANVATTQVYAQVTPGRLKAAIADAW